MKKGAGAVSELGHKYRTEDKTVQSNLNVEAIHPTVQFIENI